MAETPGGGACGPAGRQTVSVGISAGLPRGPVSGHGPCSVPSFQTSGVRLKAGRHLRHFYEAGCSLSWTRERRGGLEAQGAAPSGDPHRTEVGPGSARRPALPCPADRAPWPERGLCPAGLPGLLSCKRHVTDIWVAFPSWGRCLAWGGAGCSAGPALPGPISLLGFFTRAPNARATSGPAVPGARRSRGRWAHSSTSLSRRPWLQTASAHGQALPQVCGAGGCGAELSWLLEWPFPARALAGFLLKRTALHTHQFGQKEP